MSTKYPLRSNLIYLYENETKACKDLGLPVITHSYLDDQYPEHTFKWIAYSTVPNATINAAQVRNSLKLVHSVYIRGHTCILEAISLAHLHGIMDHRVDEENILAYRVSLKALIKEHEKNE